MLKVILISGIALLFLAVGVVGFATWIFSTSIDRDIARLRGQAKVVGTVVTDAMLAALPAPARRYLVRSGVIGKPIPGTVRLKQRGRIRSDAAAAWMELEAEEIYSTSPPSFVWRAYFPSRSVPIVMGRDEYLDGKGSIQMKMLGLVAVANEHGDELAEAGLMRYLNEMSWFPAAFLGENVRLEPVDEGSFNATISDRGMAATGTLFVDAEGNLTNFRAKRYNTGTRSMETWETPFGRHGSMAGLSLPLAGEAVWRLAAGAFSYIELEVTELVYDPPDGR